MEKNKNREEKEHKRKIIKVKLYTSKSILPYDAKTWTNKKQKKWQQNEE